MLTASWPGTYASYESYAAQGIHRLSAARARGSPQDCSRPQAPQGPAGWKQPSLAAPCAPGRQTVVLNTARNPKPPQRKAAAKNRRRPPAGCTPC
jgi:hypothetical protein